MRIVPFALASLLLAAPAVAADRDAPQLSAADAARALQNPMVQEGVALALTRLVDIVLDTRVGALAPLADPESDVRPNDTLRDVKRRDDPDYERRLKQDTRRALAQAGAVAGGVAAGSAELERTAARLADALEPLLSAMRSRDDAPLD